MRVRDHGEADQPALGGLGLAQRRELGASAEPQEGERVAGVPHAAHGRATAEKAAPRME